MPLMDFMFQQSNATMEDIRAIAIAIGPGSFTGLRIGLSAAKGIAHSLDIPIIGVSGLEAMANQVAYCHYPICPVLDSRKGELFLALFRWNDSDGMIRVKEDTCVKISEVQAYINGKTLLLGNSIDHQGPILSSLLDKNALLAPPHLWNLRASAVGMIGLKRFQKEDYDNLQGLVPTYLRPPDIRPAPVGSESPKSIEP